MSTGKSGLARLSELIDAFSLWSGRAISWLTLGMVLVTFVVVVLRYLFDLGWIWMQESVTWMHALVFMLGAAYTLARDEHVRVDIVYRDVSSQRQALVNLLGAALLLLPTAGFILWASWDYAATSWSIGERSREAGGLRGLFLLKTVIPLTALMLALQGIAQVARSVLVLREQRSEHPYEPPQV